MAEESIAAQLAAVVAAHVQDQQEDAQQLVALIPRSQLGIAVGVLARVLALMLEAPAVTHDEALERLRAFLLDEAATHG